MLVTLILLAASPALASTANVELRNAQGTKIGTAKLSESKRGVQLSLTVSNLSPGEHGIHFHEVGRCDAPDFKSAGEHFRPTRPAHGFDNPQGPHAGDLPNLVIGSSGKGRLVITDPNVTLRGGLTSLFHAGGTALVIHAKEDDQKSQPGGDSGGRIACGVVKK